MESVKAPRTIARTVVPPWSFAGLAPGRQEYEELRRRLKVQKGHEATQRTLRGFALISGACGISCCFDLFCAHFEVFGMRRHQRFHSLSETATDQYRLIYIYIYFFKYVFLTLERDRERELTNSQV